MDGLAGGESGHGFADLIRHILVQIDTHVVVRCDREVGVVPVSADEGRRSCWTCGGILVRGVPSVVGERRVRRHDGTLRIGHVPVDKVELRVIK